MLRVICTECCISVMLSVIYADSRYSECRMPIMLSVIDAERHLC
jgi:hypothetical protein